MFCSPFQFLFLKYIFCSPLQSPAWYKTICKMKVTLKGQTFQCWGCLHACATKHLSSKCCTLFLLNSWWLWWFPKLFQWFLHLKLMTQMIWSTWVKNKNKQKTHKCFIAPCWSSSSRTKEGEIVQHGCFIPREMKQSGSYLAVSTRTLGPVHGGERRLLLACDRYGIWCDCMFTFCLLINTGSGLV